MEQWPGENCTMEVAIQIVSFPNDIDKEEVIAYMSPTLAPPVAKAGLPRNPAIKRNISNPAILLESAVGICSSANRMIVVM